MAKYLTGFKSEAEAQEFSRKAFVGVADSQTKYKYHYFKHDKRNEWALVIPESDLEDFEDKQDLLCGVESLNADNWFNGEV